MAGRPRIVTAEICAKAPKNKTLADLQQWFLDSKGLNVSTSTIQKYIKTGELTVKQS